MSKATSTTTTAVPATTPGLPPTRRRLLAGSGLATALATVGLLPLPSPASGALCGSVGSSDLADGDLIRACAEHTFHLVAFNASNVDSNESPHWQAYERTLDVIAGAKPTTLAGMQAKARAAKAEARRPDGSEDPEGSFAVQWAWDLLNDLLNGAVA